MTIELTLKRERYTDKSTIGNLYIDKEPPFCYTLEDCVRETNQPVKEWKIDHETAIPRGRYRVLKTMSNRFKRYTLQIMDVPGFAGIRIHAGNTDHDTEGCILVGSSASVDEIHESKLALSKLEERLFPILDKFESVFITIS